MSEDILRWKRPQTKKELLKIQRTYNGSIFQLKLFVLTLFAISFGFSKNYMPTILYWSGLVFVGLAWLTYSLIGSIRFVNLDKKEGLKYQQLTYLDHDVFYKLLRMAGRDKKVRDYYREWTKSNVGLLRGDYSAVEGYVKGNTLKNRLLKENFN